MNAQVSRMTNDDALPSGRIAGAILIATSLFSVVLMAHHPSVAALGMSEAIAEIARKAPLSQVVHGGLIALMGMQAFALLDLSTRLGLHRATVRAAVIAYGAGVLSMTGAALVSGFLISSLGLKYDGASAETLEPLRATLAACALANRTLANFAVTATSLAMVLWSSALLARRGVARAIGALGLLAGIVPAAALLAGALRLDVGGMTLVVLAQTAWNVALGVCSIRRDL